MANQVATRTEVSTRTYAGGFAVLRIVSGVIWLSNGLAKVFLNNNSSVDLGFAKFNLINQPTAHDILNKTSANTFQPLRWIYQDVVLANWGFFAWFHTVAELAIGLSLLLGIASRLGALVAILFIGPIWIMMLRSGGYFWELPNELLPLVVLAFVPAGRYWGQDAKLAQRFGGHWPF
jgi:uncharacterized membrane protein YphA (DoxX/SURF4 family)